MEPLPADTDSEERARQLLTECRHQRAQRALEQIQAILKQERVTIRPFVVLQSSGMTVDWAVEPLD